jgi:hypothetical protein
VLVVSGGDRPEVFEFVKEPLHHVALALDPRPERDADVGPCAPLGHCGAKGVTVVGAVGEQDVSRLDGFEHVGRGSTRAQTPEDAVQNLAVIGSGHPRTFVGSSGRITDHSKTVRSKRAMTPRATQQRNDIGLLLGIPPMGT